MHDAALQLQSRAYSTSEITEVEVAGGATSVSVEARLWPHMGHVFQALPLPQAFATEARLLEFITRHHGWHAAEAQLS